MLTLVEEASGRSEVGDREMESKFPLEVVSMSIGTLSRSSIS